MSGLALVRPRNKPTPYQMGHPTRSKRMICAKQRDHEIGTNNQMDAIAKTRRVGLRKHRRVLAPEAFALLCASCRWPGLLMGCLWWGPCRTPWAHAARAATPPCASTSTSSPPAPCTSLHRVRGTGPGQRRTIAGIGT